MGSLRDLKIIKIAVLKYYNAKYKFIKYQKKDLIYLLSDLTDFDILEILRGYENGEY